ncbi:MAG: FtsW-like cell division membrane protein CA_C0505 [Olavius algarvensis Gamma 1 endosymbiont]|nr:MAG: FtsW-like cell division membrane protein CA_C0505 [Olavius algarvensis Gamma 1 endosymbiont]
MLFGCLLLVALGFLMVLGSGQAAGRRLDRLDFLPLLIYAASLAAIHLTLVLFRFRGDQMLPVAVAFLSGIGLLAQYRMGAFAGADPWASARLLLPGGVLVMLVACVADMRGRYRWLARWPWIWAGLSLLLVAGVLITGQRFRGAVYAAGLITPTELLKVTVVLFLAGLLDRDAKALRAWSRPPPMPPFRALLPLMGFWVLLAGLLFLQRDLGMFVTLSVALLIMLVAATARLGYLVYGVLAATGLGYAMLELFSHGHRRIQAWQAPFDDPTGDDWQVLQGLSGMYSGGLWGEGFGRGNPEYIPIAESDFIYAVIGEELGFLGCVAVVVFYLIFFTRGLRIAGRVGSSFGMLLGLGLTTVLATQTFLNIGGVTKFIPLTGITLPFISQGGSSLLTACFSLGLILAISDGEATKTRPGRKEPERRRGKENSSEKPVPQ